MNPFSLFSLMFTVLKVFFLYKMHAINHTTIGCPEYDITVYAAVEMKNVGR